MAKTGYRAPFFRWPFLYEGMVQLGQKRGVEQLQTCSKTYLDLSPIALLLPGMLDAPNVSQAAKVGDLI